MIEVIRPQWTERSIIFIASHYDTERKRIPDFVQAVSVANGGPKMVWIDAVQLLLSMYRKVCCGREIIIREGATFPECSFHPKLTTQWEPVDVEVAEAITIKKNSQSKPAA
jgi:hypothetical protein